MFVHYISNHTPQSLSSARVQLVGRAGTTIVHTWHTRQLHCVCWGCYCCCVEFPLSVFLLSSLSSSSSPSFCLTCRKFLPADQFCPTNLETRMKTCTYLWRSHGHTMTHTYSKHVRMYRHTVYVHTSNYITFTTHTHTTWKHTTHAHTCTHMHGCMHAHTRTYSTCPK